jgi:hypothetical protein
MRNIIRASLIGIALCTVCATGVLAAPQRSLPSHATLHVTAAFKSKAAFKHVMASAKFTYTKGDITIRLTTDGLPTAKKLGMKEYVLFASNGSKKVRAGALMVGSATMATCKHTVMMSKIQDLYLYVEAKPSAKQPNGDLVLSGMV